MINNELKKIISHFGIKNDSLKEITALGNGLINDTYKVSMSENSVHNYVLQRINHAIFQDVEMLQSNIEAVTSHIYNKLKERKECDLDRKVLHFIHSDNGKSYYYDGRNYWRMMIFIPNAKSYESVSPELSYYAGKAFGDFQDMLSDIPVKLGDTIPNFHNMEFRIKQLNEAVKTDAVGRVAKVQSYLSEINSRAEEMCLGEKLYRERKLPKRICHCDTKVNNVMFDENGNALCVIDLDTVMPNFIFSDFGDFMRTAANTGKEDDENLDNVTFDMDIFKSFTKGYLESAKFLTPIEIEYLPFAASLFPYMQAVRFLTDYINGDTYYKTKDKEHNLTRTKAQLKLFHDIESKKLQMKEFINSCLV